MKNVVWYVGDYSDDGVEHLFYDLIDGLERNGVDIVRNSEVAHVIDTPHVHLSFVTDPNKLRGRKFDMVFGNLDRRAALDLLKDPSIIGIRWVDCGALEYILKEEGY